MREKLYKYTWLLISIVLLANSLSIFESYKEIIIVVLSAFLAFKLFLIDKKKPDRFIVVIFYLYLGINIISYLLFNFKLEVITFIGYFTRIFFVYLLLKEYGSAYFKDLESLIFYLSVISIPIFFIQISNPALIKSFSSIFSSLTISEQRNYSGWYSIVYMYNGWGHERNSGFMWEPGAFSMMIVFGLLYRLFLIDFRLNYKVVFYIIALITTFSTSGYLSLSIILSMILIKRTRGTVRLVGIVSVIVLGFFIYEPVYNLEFMGKKIEKYQNDNSELLSTKVNNWSTYKAGRLTLIYLVSKETLTFPLGYGVTINKNMVNSKGEMVAGANAVFNSIYKWGILGVVFIIVNLRKFYEVSFNIKDKFIIIMALIALLIVFMSNPVSREIIFIGPLFFPLIFKKNHTELLSNE